MSREHIKELIIPEVSGIVNQYLHPSAQILTMLQELLFRTELIRERLTNQSWPKECQVHHWKGGAAHEWDIQGCARLINLN